MKRFLLFLLSIPGFAAAVFTAGENGASTLSGFVAVQNWRYEARIQSWNMPASMGARYIVYSLLGGSYTINITNNGGVPNVYVLTSSPADTCSGGTCPAGATPGVSGSDFVMRVQRDYSNTLGASACLGFVGCLTIEVWSIQGTNYALYATGLTTVVAGVNGGVQVGDGTLAAGTVDFSRLYSTLVPLGSLQPWPGAAAGDINDYEFTNAGSGCGSNCASGVDSAHGNNLTFSTGPAFAANTSYPPACSLPTNITTYAGGGPWFRSTASGGAPTTAINGGLCIPLDGTSSLTGYTWAVVNPDNQGFAPPTTPTFTQPSGSSSPLMTLGNTAFGSYTIQLQVSQSGGGAGNTTTVSQKYGAANANALGKVDCSALTTVQQEQCGLLITMIASYADTTWSEYEVNGAAFAADMMARLNGTGPNYYQLVDYTGIAQAGTVAVSTGSTTATFSSANPQVLFCGGGTSPVLVNTFNPLIVISYPIGVLYSGVRGKFMAQVTACPSSTTVTMDTAWPSGGNRASYYVPGSGYPYAYADQGGQNATTMPSVASYTISSSSFVVTLSAAVPSWFATGWHAVFTGTSCAKLNNPAGFPSTTVSGSTITFSGDNSGCTTSTGTILPFGGIGGWEGVSGSSPFNYYDCSFAFYSWWYRTGINDYLVAARQIADEWFAWPSGVFGFDKGVAFDVNITPGQLGGGEPRTYSPIGMVMRALEFGSSGGPSFDMWPGLYQIVNYGNGYTHITTDPNFPGDLRDLGIMTTFNALDCLYDDNPTNAAASCSVTNTAINQWTSSRQANNVWNQADGSGYNAWQNGFTATVTVGQSIVTAQSGFTFLSTNFAVPPMVTQNSTSILFNNGGTTEQYNNSTSTSDAQAYYVKSSAGMLASAITSTSATSISVTVTVAFPSPSFVIQIDSEQMLFTSGSGALGTQTWTVTRGYNSTTAAVHSVNAIVAGFVPTITLCDVNGNATPYVAGTACASGSCTVGWALNGANVGIQPFFNAHVARGLYYSSLALAGGSFAANAAVAKSYLSPMAGWTLSTGINTSLQNVTLNAACPGANCYPTNAPYYFRVYPTVETLNLNITGAQGLQADRIQSGEIMPVAALAQLVAPGSTNLSLGNLLMASFYSCSSSQPGYTGYCIGPTFAGSFIGVQFLSKWFGFLWGYGGVWMWPALLSGNAGTIVPSSILGPGIIAEVPSVHTWAMKHARL